ncbi:hypothetical protein AL036_19785 [Salipiger aestuarii]|uniref:F1F0 ATPase subunit 2 n=1 Tax=Salipiger aestuarii TaxID=568098 RepID=A0A327Y459_9RHOB|nr:hypothetical protein [Salipiger aestuarii]EIE48998.1 hypothetical protein C357_21142 [Citreicella sp. 357]KAA8605291.1 hypothetical protein AL036_19785 [Salipiger aestuarii]KAA8607519.1 hypothetical protein AL037_18710 [Salipiger aestuarii]KAB2536943.1 hypothetical protein AL035_19575 [Salipiger aestuarii]RAK15171.1 hypothetical protein ATI53_102573 [Salipiger aestuarii]
MSAFVTSAAIATLAALAGVGAGYLHFRSLRLVAVRLAAGQMRAVALQMARMTGLALFLYLCARLDTWALIGAAAGVSVGRAWVLRAARKATP